MRAGIHGVERARRRTRDAAVLSYTKDRDENEREVPRSFSRWLAAANKFRSASRGVRQKRRRFNVYENETVIVKEFTAHKRLTAAELPRDLPTLPLGGVPRDGMRHQPSYCTLLFFSLRIFEPFVLLETPQATSICHPHPSSDVARKFLA